jgi:hypothetical protein
MWSRDPALVTLYASQDVITQLRLLAQHYNARP